MRGFVGKYWQRKGRLRASSKRSRGKRKDYGLSDKKVLDWWMISAMVFQLGTAPATSGAGSQLTNTKPIIGKKALNGFDQLDRKWFLILKALNFW